MVQIEVLVAYALGGIGLGIIFIGLVLTAIYNYKEGKDDKNE